MPAADVDLAADPLPETFTALPFPPITKDHILHCSCHYWHPRYRAITPKARLIPLTSAFVSYLREDGIFLPDDEASQQEQPDSDDEDLSQNEATKHEEDAEEGDVDEDRFEPWRDIHEKIKSTIDELGGKVAPKLNWSAPKDATWINATNSMECRSPSDIYLLLKSSDFVTHDLEHAFDGCADAQSNTNKHDGVTEQITVPESIPYHLFLRKYLLYNPAVEFRCFVRRRKLLGICQRDLNHFDFLFEMQDTFRNSIQDFFDQKLRDTFPDDNFVFDVYIPPPHRRVWLVDINPWAPRTDPLLFSWLELLTMPEPPSAAIGSASESFVRLSLNGSGHVEEIASESESEDDDDVEVEYFRPDFRLIKKDDPEAYSFNTPQYSAHKLPRDVVDASQGGVGPLREFAEQWKEMLAKREQEDAEYQSDDE